MLEAQTYLGFEDSDEAGELIGADPDAEAVIGAVIVAVTGADADAVTGADADADTDADTDAEVSKGADGDG